MITTKIGQNGPTRLEANPNEAVLFKFKRASPQNLGQTDATESVDTYRGMMIDDALLSWRSEGAVQARLSGRPMAGSARI